MPTRRLPRTNDERTAALESCNAKYLAMVNPADRLISPAQFTDLSTRLTLWNGAGALLGPLLNAQSTSTAAVEASRVRSRRLCRHFVQVLNFAIERGEITPPDRAYYHLPVYSSEVPDMDSTVHVALWVGRLIGGEALRVAAGGTPLAWPSAAQISAESTVFNNAEILQSQAKDAYDDGQYAISSQVEAVNALIKDLWDTIEYHLRAHTPPSLRRRAREWGVIYLGNEAPEPEPPLAPDPPLA